jgi:hypothetical protein
VGGGAQGIPGQHQRERQAGDQEHGLEREPGEHQPAEERPDGTGRHLHGGDGGHHPAPPLGRGAGDEDRETDGDRGAAEHPGEHPRRDEGLGTGCQTGEAGDEHEQQAHRPEVRPRRPPAQQQSRGDVRDHSAHTERGENGAEHQRGRAEPVGVERQRGHDGAPGHLRGADQAAEQQGLLAE